MKHPLSIFAVIAAFSTGCSPIPKQDRILESPLRTMRIPFSDTMVTVDGILNEECYRENTPIDTFVVAADPARLAPATKSWLFWSNDRLVCAFDCVDPTPASRLATEDERGVNGQDRVELFIWDGKEDSTYYCIEIAPQGAVHDYSARFYRDFNHAWNLSDEGWEVQVARSPTGYTVEFTLPRTAIESMGENLAAGHSFRCGLFRADYDKLDGEPTWITWVDHGGDPDFHVVESFGVAVLEAPNKEGVENVAN